MNVGSKTRALRGRLTATLPTSWPSRRRIVGELCLVVLLIGLGLLQEVLGDGEPLRATVSTVGLLVLLPLRHVFPATALVAVAAGAGYLPVFSLAQVVISWTAGRRIAGLVRAVTAFALAAVLHVATTFVENTELLGPVTVTVVTVTAFSMLSVVPGLMSRYREQRRKLLSTLQEHNAQLLRERELVAWQARVRERNRIAQDMHDSLGHQLALISVHTGALEVDPALTGRQREGVGVLREASVAAMRELREVVGLLREEPHPSLDGTGTPGAAPAAQPPARVAAAIDDLVAATRATGVRVELVRTGTSRPLRPASDHAAYRVAQEGLTNAHKHAPGAPITVSVRYEPDSLLVEVANGPQPEPAAAGNGAAPATHPPVISGGQGLTGLRERVRLVGGMVHSGPTPEGGFRLAAVLPYEGGGEDAAPAAGGYDGIGLAYGAPPQEATSVAAAGDFRRQTGLPPVGDGGAVIDRTDHEQEFAVAMSRKRNVALGCGIVAGVVVLALVGLLVWGGARIFDEMGETLVEPDLYASIEVGTAERDIRAKLPGDGKGSWLISDMYKQGPKRPDGAVCLHFLSTKDSVGDKETVYRFCFDDGKLIEKREFLASS